MGSGYVVSSSSLQKRNPGVCCRKIPFAKIIFARTTLTNPEIEDSVPNRLPEDPSGLTQAGNRQCPVFAMMVVRHQTGEQAGQSD
jgi:hypothetical protein